MLRTFLGVFLAAFLFTQGPLRAQFDSAAARIAQAKDPCQAQSLRNEVARNGMDVDLQKSWDIIRQGLRKLQSGACPEQSGNLHNTAAIIAISLGMRDTAFQLIDTSIAEHRRRSNTAGLASALGNKGTLCFYVGDYDGTLQYQLECLRLNQQLKDTSAAATTLVNIFGVYLLQHDYPEALAVGHQCRSLFRKLREPDGEALMDFNLATVHMDLQHYDSVQVYAQRSLEGFRRLNSREGISDALRIMADLARAQKRYPEALNWLQSCLETYHEIGNTFKWIETHQLLGTTYFEMHDYSRSIAVAQLLRDTAAALDMKQFQRDGSALLMKSYAARGEYQQAYRFAEEYHRLRDEIFNEENNSEMRQMRQRFERQMRQQEMDALRSQKELLESEVRRQTMLLWTAAAIMVLLLLVFWLLYHQKQLRNQRRTMQLEQRLLRAQMSPHFIFNALTAIQNFVFRNEAREAGRYMASFARLIRSILDHSREEYIPLEREIDWLENYLQLQLLRFEDRFRYEIIVDPNLQTTELLIPPMLTQPFIENALEHGFSGIQYPGLLQVQFSADTQHLCIRVSDNGVGFGQAPEVRKAHQSRALDITRERLQLLQSRAGAAIGFSIHPGTETGTLVEFRIPLQYA